MSSRSLLRGSAALIIWGSQSNLPVTDERALNDWWTNEHLPERLAIPGFHRTRRYYYSSKDDSTDTPSTTSNPEPRSGTTSHYLVLYEVASLSTLTSPEYMHALNNPTAGTKKYMPILASMNRSACRVLFSVSRSEFSKSQRGGSGGTFARIDFDVPSAEKRADLISWLQTGAWEIMLRFFKSSLLAMHLLEHDDAASKSGSSTKSYDGVTFQTSGGESDADGEQARKWMLLVEFCDAYDAPFASYKEKCEEFADGLVEQGVDLGKLKEEVYALVVTMEE